LASQPSHSAHRHGLGRDAAVSAALGRLSESLCSAADKLRSLLDSSDERIALGAARAMLELVPKLRADGELADAVRDLERRVLTATEQ
jgi:hypothetical protein